MLRARAAGLCLLVATSLGVPLACGGSRREASFGAGDDGAAVKAAGACAPGQLCPSVAPGCAPGEPCAQPSPSCAPGQACPPPQPSTAPFGNPSTGDPNALAKLLAAAAAAGSAWLGPGGALGDPAEAGLRTAAARFAPGMSPEGPVAKGTLSEGGHIGFVVNMEPTKCYAVVAYGVGLLDLDVNLLAPPLYNLLAGQDNMAGPVAVIGAAPRPMCPVLPVTVPYKVDLFAKKGGGQVAAQLYAKPK